MKKKKLKNWVKDAIAILVIFIFGIVLCLLLSERAEEYDKAQKKELPAYFEVNR